jgi:hypothetical protein
MEALREMTYDFHPEAEKEFLSAIENDRVLLEVERAKILARALKVHPEVLVFPGWEFPNEAAA